jgi:hypothetical protein
MVGLHPVCFAVGGDALFDMHLDGPIAAFFLVLAAPVVGLIARWVTWRRTRRSDRAAAAGGGAALAILGFAVACWFEVEPLLQTVWWLFDWLYDVGKFAVPALGFAAGLFLLAFGLVACVARLRVPWPRARRIGFWTAVSVLTVLWVYLVVGLLIVRDPRPDASEWWTLTALVLVTLTAVGCRFWGRRRSGLTS